MDRIGDYKLLHLVGEGSFGVLYRAEKDGEFYALKLFKKGIPPEVLQEGKILSKIHHPHIVRYIDQGFENDTSFLVTEWIEGTSLEQVPSPSDFPALLKILGEILKGLGALHRKGLAHGDLKADNILLGREGVKLVDLGLARSLTAPGLEAPAGTLATLAPELLFGRPAGRASDFYSLGVVLYRWITGRYPFQSDKASAVIRWHLFETPFHPFRRHSFLPHDFGDFILKLLSKNPADRPQDVREIFLWLREKFGNELPFPPLEEALSAEEPSEGFELHGEAIRFYESKAALTDEEGLILAELHYQQGHFSKALILLDDLKSPVARILQTRILTRMGNFKEASQAIRKVTPFVAQFSVKENIAFLNAEGVLEFYLGRVGDALGSFSNAEKLAKASGEVALLAVAYNNLANGILEKGEKPMAEKYFHRSIELAREAGDRIHEGMFQMSLGYFFHRAERYQEALNAYTESLRILETVGQTSEKARTLLNRANLLTRLGGLAEASEDLAQAQGIFQMRSMHYLFHYSRMIEGEILRKGGRLSDSLKRFEEAEEGLKGLGRPLDALYARFHQAECLIESNDWVRAGRILDQLSQETSVSEDAQRSGHLYFLKGRCLWALKASSEAVGECFEHAEKKLEEGGDRETLLMLHYVWGRFLLQNLQRHEAARHLHFAKAKLEEFARRLPPEWRERYLKTSPFEALQEKLKQLSISFAKKISNGRSDDMENLKLPPEDDSKLEFLFRNLFEKELMKLLEELVGEIDYHSLVEKILDKTIQLTRAERGFILLKEGETPRIIISRNIDRMEIEDSNEQFSKSIASEVLKTGNHMVTVDALTDERFSVAASVHQLRLRSILCLPFKKEEEVLGAIYLDHRGQSGAFSSAMIESLRPFGDLVGQVLSNAHRFLEVEEDLKETQRKLESAEAELKIKYDYRHIVGRHPKMLEVFKILDRVTEVEVPVLILGESGVGKELAAKAIHFNGPRSAKACVSLNCQAIPEGLFEAELFGHVRGAFTGAMSEREGLIEQAHRGTLFLDEIGDMPLALQGKLLQVMQEGKFRKVGSSEEKTVDCRIIAATHCDLRALIQEGKFREDLWFRLNVVEISLPSLRERMDDLPLLLDHFLQEFADRHGGKKKTISPEAMTLLARYSWPGNVRELENTLTNACVFAEGEDITPEAFRYKQELWGGIRRQKTIMRSQKREGVQSFREAKEDFERQMLAVTLEETDGNITQAALKLKIARPQFSRMVKKYRIKL